MVKFLISRPIAVIMVFIAILMLGIVSYRLLPISLMPDIDIPEITVQVSYPGSSARELDNAITRNLRNQLMQVAHVNDLNSETRDGESIIRLTFDYGTKIDYAFIEVNEKIDAAMDYMPRDMKRPRVIKASATDLPVFYLNVSLKADSLQTNGKDPKQEAHFLELSELCENIIRKRMEQLPEVALVDVSGAQSSEIIIKPDKRKLESLKLTFDQIQQAVESSNINPGSLMVRDGNFQYYIRFISYLKTPDDIGNIYLRVNNKVMQLKDVADISIEQQKPRGYFLTGNKKAISMAIIQQADARMGDLKNAVNGLIDNFRNNYPELQFEIAQDQSQLLDFSISNLLQDLLMGGIMAFLVLFLFLDDFRAPVLIGITVPISLIISFLFFKVFHLSINIISLAGLALGLGMIIDCSIIVIENILYFHHHQTPLAESCDKGTSEVIRPMLSSTFSSSAVFVPLIFMSGIAGALFYDEAISVSLGNAASFLVAITILPVLFKLFYREKIKPSFGLPDKPKRWDKMKQILAKFRKLLSRLSIAKPVEQWYESGVDWVFRNKRLTTCLFFLMIASNLILLYVVRKSKLPDLPQTELIVNIDWNENIHLDENRRRVEKLVTRLRPSLEQSNCHIGEQQFVLGREKTTDYFGAQLYLKVNTNGSVTALEDSLKTVLLKRYPLAKVSFNPPDNVFERIFTSTDAPLLAKISVNDALKPPVDSVIALAAEADKLVKATRRNRIPVKQQLSISIDQEKLLLYGVDYYTVGQSIKTAFSENQFAMLRSFQQFMPISMGEDNQMIDDVLLNRKIRNNRGEEMPLSTFVNVRPERELKYVTAGEQGEYIPLQYEVTAKQVGAYEEKLKALVKQKHYPDVQFSGSLKKNNQMFGELSIILVISILLLYFILAAQFESLLQPLIVLLEIPSNIAGAVLLLWVAGSSLNIMSGIGIIVGCGVFINDSIIKVDTINQLRKKGLPLMQAIKQGGLLRVGGILMTASTTILAVVPFFWGNDMGSALQQPLSLALIGGMTVGTFVSLFFVPLVYWWIYRNEGNEKMKGMKP